ncbi:MAG: DUF3047 domain-containing protein [Proteobacteria bacterium]|nr:DUF3047 domain-containing protein [Pseudomonadota bacterium]
MHALARQIANAACPAVVATAMRFLPAQQPPWTPTGIALRAGQHYTLLAAGRVDWSERVPHLHGGAGFHLWARVSPGGRIVNLTRDSTSFIADCDGELEVGIYLGMWQDAYGRLDTPASAYARLRGGLEVLVLTWRDDSVSGLEALHGACPAPALAAELARLRRPVRVPADWHYLIETGTSDIYRDCSDGEHARICLEASNDQGILRKAVDWPLTPATRLAWRWRLDAHPSRVAEDSTSTHDYVSIAAEFDNGRDLTWLWSSCLPIDHWFACPIKAWSARETHYVVRTGLADAGRWCEQAREVYADVARTMGPPPSRIVAIWLICVASFQHGTARASFETIELSDGGRHLAVL